MVDLQLSESNMIKWYEIPSFTPNIDWKNLIESDTLLLVQ